VVSQVRRLHSDDICSLPNCTSVKIYLHVTMPATDAVVAQLLRTSRRIAVLGYSRSTARPSNAVAAYLHRQGYRVVGVNPAGHTPGHSVTDAEPDSNGIHVVATLDRAADLHAAMRLADPDAMSSGAGPVGVSSPIDIVDVFRNSSALPEVYDEITGLGALPRAVWLQEGVSSPEIEAALEKRGVIVVSDKCILKEHARLLGSGL
jgi:predicted CoA-binding protein